MYTRKVIVSVAGVMMFLLAGVCAMFFTSSESPRTKTSTVPARQTASITATPIPAQEAPTAQQSSNLQTRTWYVYVTGAVNSPGVYKLSEDSRVFQAVEAAGGFTRRADRSSLNLAEVLTDEAHVHVSTIGAQTQQAAPESVRIPGYSTQTRIAASGGSSSGMVDVNHADEQELQRISGVGPVIAQRIIDYRNTHGAFTRVEDLLNVKGIGASRLNQMRSQITLQGGRSSYTTTRAATSRQTNTNTNLIDINHANSQELQRIKGVGATTAQRIINYRNSHGAFTSPEDLLNVRGIGAAKLSEIRTQIVIR